MPELVAGFHSLVGLAAVMVAAAALYDPVSFGIGAVGEIHGQALVEMALGAAIGAFVRALAVTAFWLALPAGLYFALVMSAEQDRIAALRAQGALG